MVHAVAKPSSSTLVDLVLGGNLHSELRRLRAAGESYESIARWFENEHAVDITYSTVRRWCIDFAVEPVEPTEPEAAAS